MARTRFRPNLAGFAELRNDPKLVRAMESAANRATTGTPFDVDVVVWPHQGRRTGPRTSVQIWAGSPRARVLANRNPGEMVSILNRVNL